MRCRGWSASAPHLCLSRASAFKSERETLVAKHDVAPNRSYSVISSFEGHTDAAGIAGDHDAVPLVRYIITPQRPWKASTRSPGFSRSNHLDLSSFGLHHSTSSGNGIGTLIVVKASTYASCTVSLTIEMWWLREDTMNTFGKLAWNGGGCRAGSVPHHESPRAFRLRRSRLSDPTDSPVASS